MNEYAIEARVTNEGPKTGIAFAIWWFLGLLGGHRYYLGRKGSGTAMLLLSLSVFGLIISLPWWLIDGFLVSGMCREDREEMRNKLRVETMYHRQAADPLEPTPPHALI